MSSLNYNENAIISSIFNQGGYVLDFSTTDFNRFTLDSINVYNTMLEGFPKLVPDNMAVGISSVRYKLDTKALKPFIIS